MHVISYNTTSRTITGEARDALIELIMKNGAWDELDWGVLVSWSSDMILIGIIINN